MKKNKICQADSQVCREQKFHSCAVDKNHTDMLPAPAGNLHSVLERLTTIKVTGFGGR
jgi:hypothetical protein